MSPYFNKEGNGSPSHISPTAAAYVPADMTLAATYGVLCDWRSRVVWQTEIGDRLRRRIWKHARRKSMETLRAAVASVVALREKCMI
jgi:hypothetical protein